jgi:hypothetical protein
MDAYAAMTSMHHVSMVPESQVQVGGAADLASIPPPASPSSERIGGTEPKVGGDWYTDLTTMMASLWNYLMVFFFVLVAIAALILACYAFVWAKQLRCQYRAGMFDKTQLGTWVWQTGVSPLTVTDAPLLFPMAQGSGSITINAMTPGSQSYVPAPFAGELKALCLVFNDVVTSGSATFTVMINGEATALTATLDATLTDPSISEKPCRCIRFCKGDKISINMTTDALVSAADDLFQVDAKLFVNFK